MINTREIANCCYHGDGHGAWHTAQGVQGLDHRVQTPGVHVILPCLFETPEACGRLMNCPDICLKDAWRRRGGTAHLSEPSEVGRAPMGPAHLTAILSQQTGLKTELVVLESAEGIFTRPGEIAHGCILDRGDRDRGEIT
jgi:hypothetical protein